jgi:hypothetical protein
MPQDHSEGRLRPGFEKAIATHCRLRKLQRQDGDALVPFGAFSVQETAELHQAFRAIAADGQNFAAMLVDHAASLVIRQRL